MNLKQAERYAYTLIALLFFVGAVLGFLLVFRDSAITTEEDNMQDVQVEEQHDEPYTYVNSQYRFSLTIPAGWTVTETVFGSAPVFNIHPKDQVYTETYTHFTNVHHVSVYPRGIPADGIFAQTRPLDVRLNEMTADISRAFMLGSGDIFARLVYFENAPDSWSDAGFMWTRSYVADMSQQCVTENPEQGCDPLLGDELVWVGTVDDTYAQAIEDILDSFSFVQ